MDDWDAFYGPNAGYAQDLYERYLENPESVDPQTRAYFDAVNGRSRTAVAPMRPETLSRPAEHVPETITHGTVQRIVLAARLARAIREYGHLDAHIDPLGRPRPGDPMLDPATHGISDADLAALPSTIVWPNRPGVGTCLDAIRALREIYCGPLGYDFDHVENFEERQWLHDSVESGEYRTPVGDDERRDLLRRLIEIETFERFLHRAFVGQKRFSIEGNDMLVPMLDDLVNQAAGAGAREVIMGMAHRGRLSVLAHVLGKPYEKIFSEFHTAPNKELVPSEGSSGINRGWTGDVKYHLGARKTLVEGETVEVQLTLADNPSHLEFVDPTVEGQARAAQDDRSHPGEPTQDVECALPVTIHGDAAFPGEGVVAETLNLSGLRGYSTGGTIRIIVNNQIGFTTGSDQGRSTLYASDLAKGFEIPIIHVNADDPEACISVIRLAHAYRERFHKDFLIDLVGYRRWGHNEGDEPAFTQPVLYGLIAEHPTVKELYTEKLERAGLVSTEAVDQMQQEALRRLQEARDHLASGQLFDDQDTELQTSRSLASFQTAVQAGELRALNEALLARPEGFTSNPRLERVLTRRREALDRDGGIDWALAETLAFGSILADGVPIRLTGQDAERGTFSQRHLVLHDSESGRTYIPLRALPQARASFAVYNSPLTEAACLGFEYGYSIHAPDALVLWEAQFGDFANAGQVVIDQFIGAARAKWRQTPALVMLLPHGYEGQGPEHSSSRIERFLQLAAEDNVRVANCTTPAQYFHLLRVQAAALQDDRRPLILLTPKSLLRHPLAVSSLQDLSDGNFKPVLLDPASGDLSIADRLVLCSGKVAVDLSVERRKSEDHGRTAVARLELLFPFPREELIELIGRLPNLREVVWMQEEPKNMGAWTFVAPRLGELLPERVHFRYVGRPERASPAEGYPEVHAAEQARILHEALAREMAGVTGGADGR